MKNWLPTWLALFAVVSFATAQSETDVFYPGELWVQVAPEATKPIKWEKKEVQLDSFLRLIGEELAEEYGIHTVRKPFYFARTNDISEVYQLYFDRLGDEELLARELEKLEIVNYAERVPIMRPTFTPNDLGPQAGNGNQWGLWRISAQDAWDITQGSTEIRVAIVDDAVLTTHPDLIPNLVAGYDVSQDNTDPNPNQTGMTHGTHVAGIVGAATNNGIGVASIGFNIKIIPVKSSNSAQFISDAYAGVIWSADNGADVINMSWGGSGFSTTGQNIINYAFNAGCVNIAAAGNDNVSSIFYPAGYNNVVSVASTASNDAKSNFSNYGGWIDISAPGSQILSTYFNNSYAPTYANLSGTSMASPMVAGLAGLVLSVNPELPQQQVVDCILSTADNINGANPSFIGQLGSGRINAFEAVLCAQATVNAPPVAVVSSNNAVACPGGSVQFFGSSGGGLASNYNWTFPGGNPGTSTSQNPIVNYSSEGFYDVILEVSNDFGNNTITMPGYVEISSNGLDVFFLEDFEEGAFEDIGWTVENPDNSITWDLFTVGGSVSGNRAAGINLFNYQDQGQRDGLITPILDFSGHQNIQLDFQHAHRRFSAQFADSLIVMVSTDGGATYPHRVLEVSENGQGTFATGTILNQNFVPANGNDWCFGGDLGSGCFTIDLSEFDGETEVRIKFETYNDYGNNIYVDNVQLTGNCLTVQAAPVADFTSNSTSACVGNPVQYINQSLFAPTSFFWEFEGGTPATSDVASPEVTYDQPGEYTVTLTVTNPWGTDEITVENYISVFDSPVLTVNTTEAVSCGGQPVTLMASGAAEYTWSPAFGLSSTTGETVEASPASSTTYTVIGTAAGCSSQVEIDVIILPQPPVPSLVSQNQTTFAVLDPQEVQGHYTYQGVGAGWGSPNLNSVSVTSNLVIARDGTAADSLLCENAVNGAALSGNIAVIYRGGCEFGAKAFSAQQAGAAGVIIVNNVPGELMEMGGGAQGPNVTIPTAMVTAETGAWLNAQINAGNALATLGQFNGGPLQICPGETIQIAAPGGWTDYLWNNGHTGAVIEISQPSVYSVQVFSGEDCSTSSQSITVTMTNISQPEIEAVDSDQLGIDPVGGVTYQWFLNGEPIPDSNSPVIDIIGEGTYTVQIETGNGCTEISDPFEVIPTSVGEITADQNLHIFPVPSRDRVTVVLPAGFQTEALRVFTPDGRMISEPIPYNGQSEQVIIDIQHWASGTYLIQVSGNDTVLHGRFIKAN